MPCQIDDDDDARDFAARVECAALKSDVDRWRHAKGAHVVEPIATEELAQRALGDVFEQLERIGAMGRQRCHGSASLYSPIAQENRLTRAEAGKLILLAVNALEYARVHVGHLASAPPPPELAEVAP